MNIIINIARSIAFEYGMKIRRLIIEHKFINGSVAEYLGILTLCDSINTSESHRYFAIYDDGTFREREDPNE